MTSPDNHSLAHLILLGADQCRIDWILAVVGRKDGSEYNLRFSPSPQASRLTRSFHSPQNLRSSRENWGSVHKKSDVGSCREQQRPGSRSCHESLIWVYPDNRPCRDVDGARGVAWPYQAGRGET